MEWAPWLGLDIGGANIKVAVGERAENYPFPLWSRRTELGPQIAEILAAHPDIPVAVTMTGELADCYASKREGVCHIVSAVRQAAIDRPLVFYQLGGQFVDAPTACQSWPLTAAANWHAIASYSSALLSGGSGFVIDLGSTTCDIVPVQNHRVSNGEPDDTQRLKRGQLVYVGVSRTPICSLLDQVSLGELTLPLAREFFATAKDLFLFNGELAPNPTDRGTADGRPATRVDAVRRLARCFCADATVDDKYLLALVEQARVSIKNLIETGLQSVLSEFPQLPTAFVVAGEGSWLTTELLRESFPDATIVRWDKEISVAASTAAAAYSIAQLAARQSAAS